VKSIRIKKTKERTRGRDVKKVNMGRAGRKGSVNMHVERLEVDERST